MEGVLQFLAHLNSVPTDGEQSAVCDEEGSRWEMTFMDVLILRRSGDGFSHKVYWKPICTGSELKIITQEEVCSGEYTCQLGLALCKPQPCR